MIEFKIGDSKQTVPTLEGTFDYILVDGDHSKDGARIDLENVVRLCAPGGVIVFDDITPDGMDLKDVWLTFAQKYANDFHFEMNENGKGIGWAVKV